MNNNNAMAAWIATSRGGGSCRVGNYRGFFVILRLAEFLRRDRFSGIIAEGQSDLVIRQPSDNTRGRMFSEYDDDGGEEEEEEEDEDGPSRERQGDKVGEPGPSAPRTSSRFVRKSARHLMHVAGSQQQ